MLVLCHHGMLAWSPSWPSCAQCVFLDSEYQFFLIMYIQYNCTLHRLISGGRRVGGAWVRGYMYVGTLLYTCGQERIFKSLYHYTQSRIITKQKHVYKYIGKVYMYIPLYIIHV